jgi:hypothetical protein
MECMNPSVVAMLVLGRMVGWLDDNRVAAKSPEDEDD